MNTNPPYLSKLEYGSFLTYSPVGTSDLSIKSRTIIRDKVKKDGFTSEKKSFIGEAARKLAELISEGKTPADLKRFLNRGNILVPVPRSAPLSNPEALWPARRICDELVKFGLGQEVVLDLERVVKVQKAAFAKSDNRPRPTIDDHFRSMNCTEKIGLSSGITIVDDFITSGTQLLAAASLMKNRYPSVEVTAFSLVRTMSGEEVTSLMVPFCGIINNSGGSYANRD